MTSSRLISFMLALRRGLPAAAAHYHLARVKPRIHLCLSSQLLLHPVLANPEEEARLTRCWLQRAFNHTRAEVKPVQTLLFWRRFIITAAQRLRTIKC